MRNLFLVVQTALIYLESIFFLLLSWSLLRIFGIKVIKWKNYSTKKNPILLEKIYNIVFLVSQYIPLKCKCIEISSAVKIIATFHRIETSVVLGVSQNPFVAHAWVITGDFVFGVNPNNNLKVIGTF